MSETPAPSKGQPGPAKGQIESPNPLELFWEKYKPWVIAVVAVAVVGLGTSYAVAYYKKREVDQRWSAFASTTLLDQGYAEDGSLAFLLQNAQASGSQQQALQSARMYLQLTRGELATDLQSDLKEIDPAKLDAEMVTAKGTSVEPLLWWIKALRNAHLEEWGAARAALDSLEKGFPDHFLCLTTAYPPQARAVIEKEEPEEEAPAKPDPRAEPELVEPVRGSSVSLLRAQIEREEKFRQAESALYQAPEPDPEPEVVIRFAPMDEEITIRFYKDAAPEHVANFLRLAADPEKPFFQGQRVDEVHRAGTNGPATGAPRQLHFGLAASVEDDRTKWDEAKSKPSGVVLDFEDNDLSHFAGMVSAAAEPGADGKSSGERIWITANDAVQFDGQRVIFGRVVKGLEVLDEICDRAFVEEAMETNGRGKLQTNVTIDSIKVTGYVPPPPPEEENEDNPKPNEEGEGKGPGK